MVMYVLPNVIDTYLSWLLLWPFLMELMTLGLQWVRWMKGVEGDGHGGGAEIWPCERLRLNPQEETRILVSFDREV